MSGKSKETGMPAAPAWDPVVRLTHWCVALAVVLNGLIVEDESLAHVWIGYAAIAFLVLRMVWGVIGTKEARFTSFPPSLSAAKAHVGDMFAGRHKAYPSHNPIGSLMVYALWGTLAVVCVTGVIMESTPFQSLPGLTDHGLAGYFQEYDRPLSGGEITEEIHEGAANMLLFLAMLHVGGVLLESRLSGVNLVRAMVRGGKRLQGGE
tara:strand:- start:26327 stop:26947 length:621 start_codon:yes stop_codon:yes gene_type:complete